MRASSLGLVLAAAEFLAAAPAGAADSIEVAVLPVVVHSHEEHAYLQEGLSDMLRARLERIPGIAVVRIDGDGAATTDPDAAREAALAHGADYVIFGSFTQFGRGASLDVECARVQQADGEDGAASRKIFIQSGTPGEIIPRLDELAQKVARHVLRAPPDEESGAPSDATEENAAVEALTRRVEALERALLARDAEAVPEIDVREGEQIDSAATESPPLR